MRRGSNVAEYRGNSTRFLAGFPLVDLTAKFKARTPGVNLQRM
jgi:hypothetical protein